MTPKRLQLSRTKGFRLPIGAKSVARPSRWGNPFRVRSSIVNADEWSVIAPAEFMGHYPTEAAAISMAVDLHRAWLTEQLQTNPPLVDEFVELRGHSLACWCPLPRLGQPDICHAATMLELLHGPIPPSRHRVFSSVLDGFDEGWGI